METVPRLTYIFLVSKHKKGVPGGSMVKNLPANAGYLGLIPDLGEDPTCLRATKPMSHNYGACAPESGSYNY